MGFSVVSVVYDDDGHGWILATESDPSTGPSEPTVVLVVLVVEIQTLHSMTSRGPFGN